MKKRLSLAVGFMLCTILFCHAQNQLDTSIARQATQFWDTIKLNLMDSSQAPVGYKKFTYKNKTVVFFGTSHNIKDITNPMMVQIEQQINLLNPGKILVESYGTIESSKEAAAAQSDIFFCRFIGFEKKIAVASWDNNWNNIYYGMLKKLPEDELFVMLISIFDTYISDGDLAGYPNFYAL